MKKYLLKELSRYTIGTFADIIYRNALLYSDREALISDSKRITFAEYNSRVNSLIHALSARGVKKRDVIGIISTNCLEYPEIYGAAIKGGFIASPINPNLQANELEYLINYSGANTLFISPQLVETANKFKDKIRGVKNYICLGNPESNMEQYEEIIRNATDREPDIHIKEEDDVYIIFTSGTTGIPRGAKYTQRSILNNTLAALALKGIQRGDKQLTIMPLFHIGAIETMLVTFLAGGSNFILKTFNALETLTLIQKEKITDLQIVPTHLAAIFGVPDYNKYDLSSLKRILYVGSPMPVELLKKGLTTWGLIFLQSYGQTESGPSITGLCKEDHILPQDSLQEPGRLMSCGQPMIGVHARIVNDSGRDVLPNEVGEIIVQSNHLMSEYWQRTTDTKKTIRKGWLHTGDLGKYDTQGYIYIVDRKKDMIITGGENVYAREVEEIIYKNPKILEAAVVGRPDPYWVEKVHAVVSLKQGATLTADELINFCKARLARYKVPKSVEFVDSLPKNSAGKILKRELKA